MNNTCFRTEELTNWISDELQYWNIPGVTIGICTGEDILLKEGYGVRDLQTGAPMTAQTCGGIASCSKSFTSAVIASLAEEGLLSYDRPVREFIPSFRLMDPAAGEQCTIRDMLYHRTGLAPHDAMWPDPELSPEELIYRMRFLAPDRPFRSSAEYNNTVYALLGAIAAVVSGRSWEELVRERILQPLGMKRTTLSVREMRQSGSDWAKGYFGAGRQSELTEMEPWEMDIGGPAAGVNASAEDMMAWLMLHLNRGVYRGKRLFAEESMDEMHHAALDISAFPWRFPEVPGIGWYGMAWKTTFYRDKRIVYHCGEIEGYCSIELFLPDHDFGMFALCNRHKPQTPFLMELVYTCIDRYFGFPSVDWAARLHPFETVFGGSCDDWMVNCMPGEPETGTRPLHLRGTGSPMEAYTGTYSHPAYDTLRIGASHDQAGADSLSLFYKKWELPLAHWQYDTFKVSGLKEDTLYYTLPLTFTADPLTGAVDGFTLPLEPAVAPARFRKDCVCRHAARADLTAIRGIYDRIHSQEEAGRTSTGWKRDIYPVPATAAAALARGDLFVIESRGNVAGTAIINRVQVPAYKEAAWQYAAADTQVMVLHTLVIDPAFSGCGLGTAFVRFYEAYAAARGCRVLRMDTNEKNTAARDFYRRLGYREADVVLCEFNGLADVRLICLEKKL